MVRAAGTVGRTPVTIDRATPADAHGLAEFAARAFADTFVPQNRPEDIAAHLSETFGAHRQAAEIADPEIVTLLATADRQLIGYVQVRRGSAPSCVPGDQSVELWRFYVDRQWQGRGVARLLMQSVHRAAHQLGGRTLWLSVWERNGRAIAFDQKAGFRYVGTQPFLVGADRQTDHIMVAPVTPAVTAGEG